MNRKVSKIRLLSFFLILCVLCISTSIVFSAFPSTENTPAGYTGSPADDKDCSACHKAKPKTVAGIINSNTIQNTYVAEETYTITLKLKGTEKSEIFGFQVSPQSDKGKLQGKMIVTDKEQTRLMSPKYLNQTEKGTKGKDGEKIWKFDWVAPSKGTGNVCFYGSFLVGGKQEIVYNSTLILKEKI